MNDKLNYNFGDGHDWQISSISAGGFYVFFCAACRHMSNEKPPYKCPGVEAGKRIWEERLIAMNPELQTESVKKLETEYANEKAIEAVADAISKTQGFLVRYTKT